MREATLSRIFEFSEVFWVWKVLILCRQGIDGPEGIDDGGVEWYCILSRERVVVSGSKWYRVWRRAVLIANNRWTKWLVARSLKTMRPLSRIAGPCKDSSSYVHMEESYVADRQDAFGVSDGVRSKFFVSRIEFFKAESELTAELLDSRGWELIM